MKTTWRLDSLYKGFDDPKLLDDLKAIEHLNVRYTDWMKTYLLDHSKPKETLESYLDMLISDTILLRKLQAFGHLSFTVDSSNQKALALKNKVQEAATGLTEAKASLQVWLKDYEGLSTLCRESTLIEDHRFFLEELKVGSKHMLSPKQEHLIALLKPTGSSAWETLQSKVSSQLTGTMTIGDTQKTLPIMSIRNLAFNSDPALRKAAYEAELKAYASHEEISAAALSGIKGEVLTLSEMRGFSSPLEETLFNARMSQDILDAMIETMEAYLPVFRSYVLAKSKHLGHEKGMPFYDLFAPVGNANVQYGIDEAKNFIVQQFGNYSKKLSDFAKKCFDSEWVDFEPRAGKVGGAFCSNIPSIKESRVLLNFNGTLKNVFTIAHELGHAYHGECIFGESILNTSYPMPLAETASIFCETIVRNALLEKADQEEQLTILESSLSSASQVVMDILSRFYFESEIFEARKNQPLSVDTLKSLMTSAQKKAYGDALNPDFLHPYMWLNKTHYYYAQRNFYNFPYAFGLLFARGLYAIYKSEGDSFLPKYDELLKNTGKMSIYDVCMSVGIDPTKKSFWEGSLKQIQEEVEAYKSLLSPEQG